jgi:hypothetical protein
VGWILAPLRGYGLAGLFHDVVEILIIEHTESAVPLKIGVLVAVLVRLNL